MPRSSKSQSSRKPNRPRKLWAKQREFIAAYSQTGNPLLAAQMCGLSRGQYDKWIQREKLVAKKRGEAVDDYPFHIACAEAQEVALQRLEAIARRRAELGVKKFKFCHGKPITDPETGEPYFEFEYDTRLLIFLLKALKPEKYRDRLESRGEADAQSQPGHVAVYVPENNRDPADRG